ncbi:MAG: hypothetical protein GXO82_06165, partial [Chlorobi bacterium]|nr:hypothetical protein [Chlorobiota bacterium]
METNTAHNRSLLRQMIPVLLPLAVLVIVAGNLEIDPAEDAHIMFRYAHNLAGGYGLAWNPGDAPVEGATEFLWTLLLTGGVILGIDVGAFAQGAALLFAGLTVVVMYFSLRRLLGVRPLFAAGATVVFAAGPISVQALSGFGTPLFTFLMVCSWICLALLTHCDYRIRDRAARALPVLWLLLGLSRPEGVFFSVLEFLSALILLGYAKTRNSTGSSATDSRAPTIRVFFKYCLLFFALPGLLYFLWRWQYFG